MATSSLTWRVEWDRESRVSWISWFAPQMPATARARAGKSQDLKTASRSPTWWQWPRPSGPSSTVFQGTLERSWFSCGGVETETSHSHMECRRPRRQLNLLLHNACPNNKTLIDQRHCYRCHSHSFSLSSVVFHFIMLLMYDNVTSSTPKITKLI